MKYKKITFPKDSFPHDKVIEWWYFNGHLKDSKGNNYSFMNCLFRADAKKVKIPLIEKIPLKNVYFYHSLISDMKEKKFCSDVKPLVLVSQDSFSKNLFYVDFTSPSLKGYFNYEIEETGKFQFRIKSKFFDLVLKSAKKPLLEGGRGFLNLNGKQTFYYSFTNMKTEGWIIKDNRRIKVKGKSWMDHQWADEHYTKDTWSWFSIQLDNDVEVICFEYDDKKKKSYLASIVDKRGRARHTSDVFLKPKKKWRSPKTGAVYPMSWRIVVPDFKLDIETEALMKTQEVLFSTINYWEGPVEVKGRLKNRSIKGKGFMELASYPMKKSLSSIYRKQLLKSLESEILQTKDRMLSIEKSIIHRRLKKKTKK